MIVCVAVFRVIGATIAEGYQHRGYNGDADAESRKQAQQAGVIADGGESGASIDNVSGA